MAISIDLTISENDNELQRDYILIVSRQAYTSLLFSLSSISFFFFSRMTRQLLRPRLLWVDAEPIEKTKALRAEILFNVTGPELHIPVSTSM